MTDIVAPAGPEPGAFAPTEWIVAFEPRTSLWWGKFLPEGFGHCFCFGMSAGVWVSMEPLIQGTRIAVCSDAMVMHWFTQAKIGNLKLLKAAVQGHSVVRPRFFVTCAGAIGSVLGMKRLPITPHGLFWKLRRSGAQEVGRAIDG